MSNRKDNTIGLSNDTDELTCLRNKDHSLLWDLMAMLPLVILLAFIMFGVLIYITPRSHSAAEIIPASKEARIQALKVDLVEQLTRLRSGEINPILYNDEIDALKTTCAYRGLTLEDIGTSEEELAKLKKSVHFPD